MSALLKTARMADKPSKRRSRLDPQQRRSLILDHAADLVAKEGVSVVSMDSIALAAGVSKSLVYNYFANLNELLRELLERELRRLRREQSEAAENATTFEGLVRAVTHVYLKYIDERGLIIERLQHEPSISDGHDPTEYSRDAAVSYLAEIFSKHFELPLDLMQATTDICFGLPATAGSYLLRNDMPRQQVEDLTVTMIAGAIMAVKNGHMLNQRRLRGE